MLEKYENFIYERYGSDGRVKRISDSIFSKLKFHIKELLDNGEIIIDDIIEDDIIFVNSKMTIVLSNRDYGYVNIDKVIFGKGYVNNLEIYIEMKLSLREIYSLKIDPNNKVRSTISHEIHHLIDRYYLSLSSNEDNNTWKRGRVLQSLINKYNDDVNDKHWNSISYFIYLSLSHEMKARVQGLSSEIEGMDFEEAFDYITQTIVYKDVKFLSDINVDLLMKKMKTDLNYDKYSYDFVRYFLQVDPIVNIDSHIRKFMKSLKNKNKKLLKKIMNVSYLNLESSSFEEQRLVNLYSVIKINYDEYL